MKIIFAPDSFKGTIRSPEVCNILQKAFQEELPGAQYVCLPMADGGEGTVEAVLAAGKGERRQITVKDPLGRPVQAEFAFLPETAQAVIEMASASGLELLDKTELNPLLTSTFGTGQLLLEAQRLGAREIIIGIGGSATVDGGAGMARALGCRLFDADGQELPEGGGALRQLATLDLSGLAQWNRQIKVRVACDVTNPLTGPAGATAVFAPQKGATPEMLPILEAGLQNWGNILIKLGLIADTSQPGDGAAGGLGAGLRALLGARMESGARLIAELVGLEEHLSGASLLITGEGCTDEQTCFGKLPAVVAELANSAGVPAILLSGAVKGSQNPLREKFQAIFSTLSEVAPLDKTLAAARENLYNCARAVAATLRIANCGK
ncbi:MAG: glycerate kinase [Lentisphaerae bacterium]|jgi:glycerate kinase|nr:glycerate kinase [Lentisphaerota bacterium]